MSNRIHPFWQQIKVVREHLDSQAHTLHGLEEIKKKKKNVSVLKQVCVCVCERVFFFFLTLSWCHHKKAFEKWLEVEKKEKNFFFEVESLSFVCAHTVCLLWPNNWPQEALLFF